MTEEAFFTCPSCWEKISVVVDCSVRRQSYVEDCEVCCRPLLLRISCAGGRVKQIEAELT